MCGIAGYLDPAIDAAAGAGVLAQMGQAIQHRGPDDVGIFAEDGVGLTTRRLSIIDLAGGRQPMATEDGRLVVAFNGEIYNHREVARTLEQRGIVFSTASDTEVVLRLLAAEGLAGLARLNGMFAIALWDRRDRRLHLIRDRFGVKPLYYAWDGRRLWFASEIKALLAGGAWPTSVEPHALWDYLTFRYCPAPRTIWRQIFKLPPGHHLSIVAGNPASPTPIPYWEVPFTEHAAVGPAPEAGFDALFEEAVRLRLIADVPVGVLLSGGLDSSAVAAVAAAHRPERLHTFSVRFADAPEMDELPFARQVAHHLGTDHHEVSLTPEDFVGSLESLVHHTDEPLADLAAIPLAFVCRLARRSVKVVLSGEGGDEILAGYTFDRVVADWTAAGITDLRTWREPPHMTKHFSSAEKRSLLRDGTAYPDSLDVIRAAIARAGAVPPLHQMLYAYCQNWLVEDLLMKADRMSMAYGLELRTPFLDYRLVEWVAWAPAAALVAPGANGRYQSKAILRRFAAGRLPPAIIDRPKQGFPVPVYGWLSGRLRSWARALIHDELDRLSGWFARPAVLAVLERGTADQATAEDRHRLFLIIVLAHWMRRWLDGRSNGWDARS